MQSPVSFNGKQTRKSLPHTVALPSIAQTLAFWRDPHAYLRWCRNHYGPVFTMQPFGKPPMVFMSEATDIKRIVTASADVLHPGQGGQVIAPLVGSSSFMIADGTEHLAGRQSIVPSFHGRLVATHEQMVHATVAHEIASWPVDTPVALHPRLRTLTLRVILQTIFGAGEQRIDLLHSRLLAMFSVSASLALHTPALRHAPPWRRIWQQFVAERASVHALIEELIAHAMHTRAHDDMLPAMLLRPRNGEGADAMREARSTLLSLILAGHETTAAELAWAVQLLAHHRGARRRLVRELEHDGSGGEYLDAVIKEVLRHRPVFLFTIPRAVAKPVTIGAHTYRPPVHLLGCLHLMQHDAAHYFEPECFRPERFLDEPPSPDVWLPWGGGRKRCPGHHLAMLEMRTVLRTMLEQLDIEPADSRLETARWRTVIVTPGNGCQVLLRRRRSCMSMRVGGGSIYK